MSPAKNLDQFPPKAGVMSYRMSRKLIDAVRSSDYSIHSICVAAAGFQQADLSRYMRPGQTFGWRTRTTMLRIAALLGVPEAEAIEEFRRETKKAQPAVQPAEPQRDGESDPAGMQPAGSQESGVPDVASRS